MLVDVTVGEPTCNQHQPTTDGSAVQHQWQSNRKATTLGVQDVFTRSYQETITFEGYAPFQDQEVEDLLAVESVKLIPEFLSSKLRCKLLQLPSQRSPPAVPKSLGEATTGA